MATDFSSLDKLMEFGLGLGIATQMMNTMNSVIARTAVPGVGINPGIIPPNGERPGMARSEKSCEPVAKTYYIVNGEHVAGPMTEHELSKLVEKGLVDTGTFCWSAGMHGWKLAQDIPEINKLILLNS